MIELLNIVIPYDWNKFVSCVKSLRINILQMDLKKNNDCIYVIN